MKFTCTQENLNRGLNLTCHVANRNATLPILNNVLIRVTGGVISLSTTNLEIGIAAQIRGKVEKEGEFTVQARLLADYVNLLPKENIELELENETIYLRCGKYKTFIKGAAAVDFPLIPEMERKESVVLKSRDLKNALAQAMFAVALDESRPEISGVFFNFSGKTLTIAGTDSYRLAEKKVKLSTAALEDRKLIIPLRTLQEVHRILTDSPDEEISIYLNENQILFKLNNEVELVSRLVEGQYPDYQQIIPTTSKTQAKVKTAELNRVVKSVSLFCKPGINDVKLDFKAEKGELVVSAVNSAIGENLVTVEAAITGDDNEAVFNYRYLLDGLNNLGSEEIKIELISNTAPGLIKPVGDDDYLYIVMPIRQ
ncbi:MAG: DNA polymerase III subunit beta [Candidatus Komeilibacteria bacterium RIFCSPLOWO2_01_FULL_45_10]|uniref:Beta sliding clamp n=1 Tax=Candidatus Komeilibacteria bacterium RIFCSPLOWO2_01_FULL_45_10 TaxID=1798550 RepID=A0A1G2BLC2_9BACT|nr:MAG: DNA polymerase III subunit beta [Candidatus Komeilibacteria bacterium RIFCSPLOWO2_01_FULL_45_10]